MSAITDHNTGANKVSPICERPSAGGNINDVTFDLMSFGDATAQNDDWMDTPLQGMDNPRTFWLSPLAAQAREPPSIDANIGTHGRGNGPTPTTDQTLAKVCFP